MGAGVAVKERRFCPKPHHALYAAAFLLDSAVTVALTTTPFFLYERVGGGVALSGLAGGLQMAAYAAACLVSSRYEPRTGTGLRWAMAGATGFAAAFCLMPFFPSAVFCVLASTAAFVFLALAWPAMQAWLGAEPDSDIRARRLGVFNVATSFGFATGPLLAGPLFDLNHWLPFALLAIIAAAVVALLGSLPAEHRPHELSADSAAFPASSFSGARYLVAAWCATLTANALTGMTRSVFPKRVEELASAGALHVWPWGVSPLSTVGPATAYSWLAFALSATAAGTFFLMGASESRRRYAMPSVFLLQAACAGGFWTLGRTESLVAMAFCFTMAGAATGAAFFQSMYLSLADPVHRHGRAAVNESMVGIGGCIGGVLVGQLAGAYGVTFPFRWTPLAIVLALALQSWLVYRARAERPKTSLGVRLPGVGSGPASG